LIGVVLAATIAAAYVAYVFWVAFSSNAGTQPRPPTREGIGCVLMGLGVPLLLGGVVAAIGWPSWRTTGLVAAAAGGAGVLLSLVSYATGEQEAAPAAAGGRQAGSPPAPEGSQAPAGGPRERLADTEPGWVVWTLGLLAAIPGGLVLWLGSTGLRLAGIIALTVGAGLLAAGFAAYTQVVRRAEPGRDPGWWRRDRVVLALLALVAVSASAAGFFFAAFVIRDSATFTRRYGIQVEAAPDSCLDRLYLKTARVRRTCEASWVIGGETRRGTLIYTSLPRDSRPLRPAHVLDTGARTAYTAPPAGTPAPQGAYLALGRIDPLPLLPALLVQVLAWALLRWVLPRRAVRAAAAARGTRSARSG